MVENQKGAILCPNCGRLISRSETNCPHCGIRNPSSRWKSNSLIRGLKDADFIIKAVIITNACIFLLSLLLFPNRMGMSMNPLNMLSPSNESLLLLGATGVYPIDHMGRWWSLLSANYLHGGILHILFNMFAFNQLAPLVSREFGSYRMLSIYTIGGVAGFAVSYFAGVTVTIGASAGICSLIGATLYYGKSRGGVYGQALARQVSGWVMGLFIFGIMIPGINNWGHGGGLLAGAALGLVLGYNEKIKENLTHKILGGICAGLTVVVLFWAIFTAIVYRISG